MAIAKAEGRDTEGSGWAPVGGYNPRFVYICINQASFEMCTNITASKYSVICISAESEYEVGISSAEEYRVGPRVKINKYSFDMRR